ncbi:MAG TPA: YcaO-like family protein, partial [Jatrophihabitans sp.]|nr:YcaO-like family protein [Jatrophihabitans sp.]
MGALSLRAPRPEAQPANPYLSEIATPDDRSMLRLPGTRRARPPSATLAMARAAAAKVGITRVADITQLDTVGIPTYQAIRPLSRTLSVSQGKGMTAELAKLSAMMESIELWHVEQPMPPVRRAASRELGDLGYSVGALAPATPSVFHDGLPLDWLAARSMLDGAETLVPIEVVRLSLEQRTGWQPPAFFESTNGLASGNTLVEGALHALYEVIERDATTTAFRSGGELGSCIEPASLRSALVDQLCAMLHRADVLFEVRLLPSPTGLPCFLAWVSSEDFPAEMYGFGCHLNAEIALTRAVTEAIQTRLCYISGARDDLKLDVDGSGTKRPRIPSDQRRDVDELLVQPAQYDSVLEDLCYVVEQTAAAFGQPPLLVDLSHPD